VSCVKTAEPIVMQFRLLSHVGPGNMHYTEMYMHLREKHCKA